MRRSPLAPLAFVAASVLAVAACSHAPAEPRPPGADASTPPPDGGPGVIADAGSAGDGAQGPPCFTNPTTYLEIINACTDAQAVDKQDDLSPMNLADGGLQPLP